MTLTWVNNPRMISQMMKVTGKSNSWPTVHVCFIYLIILYPFGLLVSVRCASDRYYITNIAKFVKDYVFIRTLAGYNFLRGVSVGFSGYYIDTHTFSSAFHFDTQHDLGSVLEPARFYFGT